MRRLILMGALALALAGCSVETFEDGSVIVDAPELMVTVPAYDSPDDMVRIHIRAAAESAAMTTPGWVAVP